MKEKIPKTTLRFTGVLLEPSFSGKLCITAWWSPIKVELIDEIICEGKFVWKKKSWLTDQISVREISNLY